MRPEVAFLLILEVNIRTANEKADAEKKKKDICSCYFHQSLAERKTFPTTNEKEDDSIITPWLPSAP